MIKLKYEKNKNIGKARKCLHFNWSMRVDETCMYDYDEPDYKVFTCCLLQGLPCEKYKGCGGLQ